MKDWEAAKRYREALEVIAALNNIEAMRKAALVALNPHYRAR